ncbi:hypothetical protein [Mycolicibacterium neoaurum]|uniref:hypothetical protein n=1 Tax=Mycolicibacterium neoaurum TaxID=1795 RepID=UPI001F4CFA44|nr:hypothetical protein [Mycolicibacterium neoaurum]
MSNDLAVDESGLQSASANFSSSALEMARTNADNSSSRKPSVLGASAFAAEVQTFRAAYSNRLMQHGSSVATAAARYAASDGIGSQSISSVTL